MNVSGQFTVHAPREVVFRRCATRARSSVSSTACSDLKRSIPTHYAAVFETKVAYMKFSFKVTVEVTRVESPREIEAKVEGTPLGIVGRMTATAITTLTEAGDETKVAYEVEAALAGKLGSIGQPVLRSKAKEMEKQFAATAARRLRASPPEAAMIPFELAEPTSLAEAIALLDPDDAAVRPIAGGTALMLMMKAGVFRPTSWSACARSRANTRASAPARDGLTHRRDDAALGARALRRGAQARAGDHAHAADALERARAQRRDGRRRAGAWRSAHGPAAGADRARRDASRRRAQGRAQARGRGPVRRLLRDRAGARTS